MKKVKDLKIGDELYISNQYTKEIFTRNVWQIFQDKDYMYIIDEHKSLCFGKNDSTKLYSRENSNIYLNKNEIFNLQLLDLEKSIESSIKEKEGLTKKYNEDIESIDIYLNRKNKELLQMKNSNKNETKLSKNKN